MTGIQKIKPQEVDRDVMETALTGDMGDLLQVTLTPPNLTNWANYPPLKVAAQDLIKAGYDPTLRSPAQTSELRVWLANQDPCFLRYTGDPMEVSRIFYAMPYTGNGFRRHGHIALADTWLTAASYLPVLDALADEENLKDGLDHFNPFSRLIANVVQITHQVSMPDGTMQEIKCAHFAMPDDSTVSIMYIGAQQLGITSDELVSKTDLERRIREATIKDFLDVGL